jgi:DNA primase
MDAVEEIKSRLAIEDVIGEYVQLKRGGRNWRGLSPFGNEKTPSFMVSPEKQIWHDFSSGKGGNMFSFVMEMEGLDFKGALELLARKAGVDLEQYRGSYSSTNSKLKERAYDALELATKFYQAHFKQNQAALEYILKKRQFSKATALEWRIGYSPNTGDALGKFLRSKDFSEKEIKAAGLSAQRYRGVGDMFRGRIMIPLADPQGRIVGFTARLLEDDPNAPKYINTPATLLYDKSRHVFGLHLAKEAIRKNSYAVLVEGNMDVIASHQASVKQVVATAGTALTEQHLKTIGRFTEDIRLSFDADLAGLQATERAIPIAAKVGVNLSIITMPSGKDPDELIRSQPDAWQKAIDQPQYALDWLMERYQKLLDVTSAKGKREFSDVILAVVRGLTDQVEQEHYVDKIATLIDVSHEALLTKLHQNSNQVQLKRKKTEAFVTDKQTVELTKVQDHLLSLAFVKSKLRDFLKPLTAAMLVTAPGRELLKVLQDNPQISHKPEDLVQNLADYAKILVLQFEELYHDLEYLELRLEAARLQARLIEHYVKTKKQTLARELTDADEEATQTLLAQVKALDQLLSLQKGEAHG